MIVVCTKTFPFPPYCLNPKRKEDCKLSPDTCGFTQTSQQRYEAMPGHDEFEKGVAERKEAGQSARKRTH